jgi:hypothetical protein
VPPVEGVEHGNAILAADHRLPSVLDLVHPARPGGRLGSKSGKAGVDETISAGARASASNSCSPPAGGVVTMPRNVGTVTGLTVARTVVEIRRGP